MKKIQKKEKNTTLPLYTLLETEKDEKKSEITFTIESPFSEIEKYRQSVLDALRKNFSLPGFRVGHVPYEVLIENVGEMSILEECTEKLVQKIAPLVLEESKSDIIGQVSIQIKKLAKGNPVVFTLKGAVFPSVSLPDYKKIAEKVRSEQDDPEKISIEEGEVQKELERLYKMVKEKTEAKKEGDSPKEEVGDLDDSFAKKMGDFKNLEELKLKIKEGMMLEKKQKTSDKRRIALLEALIKETKCHIPSILIDAEARQMMAEFEGNVERAGMTFESYLSSVSKTKEDLLKEWRPDAEKRAFIQIILEEIAKKENITLSAEKVQREVLHLKEHYKDAEEKALFSYVEMMMKNDAVYALLEKGEEK
jgi:FKBP-type peptidyl-prolyl cis-trans isomerase (trigger factor)